MKANTGKSGFSKFCVKNSLFDLLLKKLKLATLIQKLIFLDMMERCLLLLTNVTNVGAMLEKLSVLLKMDAKIVSPKEDLLIWK